MGGRTKEEAEANAVGEDVCRELATRTVLFNEAMAERLGLNVTDHRCLELIDRASGDGAITAGKLSELTGLTSGAITGVLDRLERAGFVRREKGPADRRQVQITLVSERMQEVGALFASLSAGYAALAGSYTGPQLTAIVEFIRGASALLTRETERLRAQDAEHEPPAQGMEELSAPLAGIQAGRFEISRGAANLGLGSVRGAFLYRVRHEGPAPEIKVRNGSVHVEYNRSALRMLAFRKHALQIDLSERIPWDLVLKGGANKLQADLRQLKLKGVDLHGGANHVTLELPVPSGIVPLRISGGATQVRLLRPKRSVARVQISGGVNHLTIDTLELGAVGGTMRWESPGFETRDDGYEIQISGGANHLVIAEQ